MKRNSNITHVRMTAMAKSRLRRLKEWLIRRQIILFGIILTTGLSLLAVGILVAGDAFPPEVSRTVGPHLISEGVAFIIIGLVGLLMSWTTFEIGLGIKEVVREVGRENREAGRENREALAKSVEAMGEGIKEAVREVGRENREARKENREALAALAKSQEAIGEGIKEAVREGIKEAVREASRENREAVRENREMMASITKSLERISASQDRLEASYKMAESQNSGKA